MKSIDKKGFTLIELLVVVSIVSLLSSIILASLSNTTAKARDARRISDLLQLQKSIEISGTIPSVSDTHSRSTSSCLAVGSVELWTTTAFNATFQNLYMKKLPEDPKGVNDPDYCYTYTPLPLGVPSTNFKCQRPNESVGQSFKVSGYPTGTNYSYLITFKTETDQSSKFPKLLDINSTDTGRYCLLGPER